MCAGRDDEKGIGLLLALSRASLCDSWFDLSFCRYRWHPSRLRFVLPLRWHPRLRVAFAAVAGIRNAPRGAGVASDCGLPLPLSLASAIAGCLCRCRWHPRLRVAFAAVAGIR
ncbi:hypothetical protein J8I87_10625, partial [Paraburkholderia sp. LEh10]|uniref:hypothetical protein n=1 Tax=Paraburkholderia sp. LEh10 TaxID=2821353 RepID=UPI001AE4886E